MVLCVGFLSGVMVVVMIFFVCVIVFVDVIVVYWLILCEVCNNWCDFRLEFDIYFFLC